ncbi:MAG: hypothetical protein J0M09_08450 [Xanthomonadales bacterium]|nr:hypothetical protein [Xanthomonadales bacterium]
MTFQALENLKSRLSQIEPLDYASANALLRDAIICARKTFGENSPHISKLENVLFEDPRFVFNSGNYQVKDNWNSGVKHLQSILDAMSYEMNLEKTKIPDLNAPAKVTLDWLIKHVPIKFWGGTLAILITTFLLGYSVGKNDLLRQIISAFQTHG